VRVQGTTNFATDHHQRRIEKWMKSGRFRHRREPPFSPLSPLLSPIDCECCPAYCGLGIMKTAGERGCSSLLVPPPFLSRYRDRTIVQSAFAPPAKCFLPLLFSPPSSAPMNRLNDACCRALFSLFSPFFFLKPCAGEVDHRAARRRACR